MINSVIDERGRCCMHLRGTRCPAPNQAHVHRESCIPSRAAPNPVAWHMFLSVRMVMIGQAHAATAANAILGTSPSSSAGNRVAGGGVGRWVAHRTRQLGFTKLRLPQLHNSTITSIFDTCLNTSSFKVAFTCYALLLSRCTRP